MPKRPKRHPYRQWLPYPSDNEYPESRYSGSPSIIKLRSYMNDKSMRGSSEHICCDCGSVHLITYEVFKDVQLNEWWLAKRAYRLTIAEDLERKEHFYPFKEKKKR